MRSLVLVALVAAAASAFVVVNNDNVVECEMCLIAVRVAAPALGRDTQLIENDFIKECEKVVTGKAGVLGCTAFANKELGGIIKELESGTAPKDVCTKLHGC